MEPEGIHVTATKEPSYDSPLPSLFICFAFSLLFLLDSVIALEPRTSSLFCSFNYSIPLQITIITNVIPIVPFVEEPFVGLVFYSDVHIRLHQAIWCYCLQFIGLLLITKSDRKKVKSWKISFQKYLKQTPLAFYTRIKSNNCYFPTIVDNVPDHFFFLYFFYRRK